MPYYRSTAYIISQGFQKFLIYYFTIFLLITTNFKVDHSNLQKSEKENVNLTSRTLKFLQIKSEQTDPLLHYSYESTVCSLALPFLLIVARSPSRESEQGRPSELTAPAVGGHAGVGEVAVEHQGADAHA